MEISLPTPAPQFLALEIGMIFSFYMVIFEFVNGCLSSICCERHRKCEKQKHGPLTSSLTYTKTLDCIQSVASLGVLGPVPAVCGTGDTSHGLA